MNLKSVPKKEELSFTSINNQAGNSRMDTILKMLLIAFVSLLAFSSGVYFGKQLSDSDYQLKALESDFNHGGVAKSDDHGDDSGDKAGAAMSPEEVAALSEKLVNNEKTEMAAKENSHSDGHGDDHGAKKEETRAVASTGGHGANEAEADHEDSHAPPAAATAHAAPKAKEAPAKAVAKADAHGDAHGKPDLTAATKAAQRVAHGAVPEEPAKIKVGTRTPTSLPKTVGASHDVEFTVQVASYPTAEAARDYANDLVAKGFPAFPVEANVGGKVWYRVSVGSFKSQKEATTYRAQLMKQASLPSAIVQKIQR